MVTVDKIGEVVHSYKTADKFLGKTWIKKLAHETYVIRRYGFIEVTLFGITIVRYYPHDEYMMILTKDHQTKTSKQRLNQLTPQRYSIYQVRKKWYVHDFRTGEELVYSEGMLLFTN